MPIGVGNRTHKKETRMSWIVGIGLAVLAIVVAAIIGVGGTITVGVTSGCPIYRINPINAEIAIKNAITPPMISGIESSFMGLFIFSGADNKITVVLSCPPR